MQELRKPFFYAAFVVVILILAIELGSAPVISLFSNTLNQTPRNLTAADVPPELRNDFDDAQAANDDTFKNVKSNPGIGISYLVILDGILMLTMGLMVASTILAQSTYARVQGISSCLVSLLLLIFGILLIIIAIISLLLMVALLLAIPFGTLVYLALYGFFDRIGAGVSLGLIMTLKIAFCVLLILAQQRFLQNRFLILLALSSLICTFIISFLHGIVPIILVSITDNISGICVAICGVIWAVIVLIGAIPSVIKALSPPST